jgi:hypothetical protein
VNTSQLLLVAGVFLLSQSLRSTQSAVLNKLGIFGHVGTSFLLGWFLSSNWWVGVVFASIWFVWPWYELITRVRKIVLPSEKNVRHKSPPHRDFFPALDDLTSEIEAEGFEHVEDLGRDWEDMQQFYRVMYNPKERVQAVVCLMEQERFAFYYVRLTSHGKDGRVWLTWNYPFSLNLQLAKGWHLNRQRGDQSFVQLLQSHQDYLLDNSVEISELQEDEPEKVIDTIQHEQDTQIAHNVTTGILKRAADGQVRYTWRGLLFIWTEFLRDFVRLV